MKKSAKRNGKIHIPFFELFFIGFFIFSSILYFIAPISDRILGGKLVFLKMFTSEVYGNIVGLASLGYAVALTTRTTKTNKMQIQWHISWMFVKRIEKKRKK